MRLDTLALAALVFVVPSYAQYFSAGWTPGQAAPTTETPEPTSSSLVAESTPLPPPLQGQSRFGSVLHPLERPCFPILQSVWS